MLRDHDPEAVARSVASLSQELERKRGELEAKRAAPRDMEVSPAAAAVSAEQAALDQSIEELRGQVASFSDEVVADVDADEDVLASYRDALEDFNNPESGIPALKADIAALQQYIDQAREQLASVEEGARASAERAAVDAYSGGACDTPAAQALYQQKLRQEREAQEQAQKQAHQAHEEQHHQPEEQRKEQQPQPQQPEEDDEGAAEELQLE